MDRRLASLVLLFGFVLCTGAAILVGAGRPAAAPGLVPAVVQGAGLVCALVAAALLRADGAERAGGVIAGAVVLLAVLDAVALAGTGDGATVGAGLLRLVCLLLIGMATARLAVEVARSRRAR